jgi:hypothetical protein
MGIRTLIPGFVLDAPLASRRVVILGDDRLHRGPAGRLGGCRLGHYVGIRRAGKVRTSITQEPLERVYEVIILVGRVVWSMSSTSGILISKTPAMQSGVKASVETAVHRRYGALRHAPCSGRNWPMCAWGTTVSVKGLGKEPEGIRANRMRPGRTDANERALAHRLTAQDFVVPFRGQYREDSSRGIGVGVPGPGAFP